jgi:hypothetical protein
MVWTTRVDEVSSTEWTGFVVYGVVGPDVITCWVSVLVIR